MYFQACPMGSVPFRKSDTTTGFGGACTPGGFHPSALNISAPLNVPGEATHTCQFLRIAPLHSDCKVSGC